jgi:hypothetical protein
MSTKIKFKNGSTIDILNSKKYTRGQRSKIYPVKFLIKFLQLTWYQKIYLWFYFKYVDYLYKKNYLWRISKYEKSIDKRKI